MKLSEHWLREFIDPPATVRELGERLTLAGIEVTSVMEAIPDFDRVVVAQVEAVAPHPSADRLKVCRVNVGAGGILQIVCGAPNVRPGLKTALVQTGGRLPGGQTIRTSKLRGVESQGMLCSARELGLFDDHSGILELPEDAVIGRPLTDALGGADAVLEVEITPNRGDVLSVLGIARELGAIYDLDLHSPAVDPVPAAISDRLTFTIEASAACPVFAGRVLRGLRTGTVTPLWMTERLRRAGLRSVSPLVDVTQYVMLELGQPMHAYDLARIHGGLRVRFAEVGEQLRLLNGTEILLQSDMLVIADDSGAIGLAGLMGGQSTAVTSDTTDVFLESACFSPAAVQGRGRRLGLTTDAGYRFERGVDPGGQLRALERATQLLQEIAGGEAGPVGRAGVSADVPRSRLDLRARKLETMLGITVPERETRRILEKLGFAPEANANGWRVTVPSWRYDIEIEEDLVEEVGRIFGYEHISAVHPSSQAVMAALPEKSVPIGRLRDVLVNRGYQEIVTYSFVEGAAQRLLTGKQGIPLANPISDQMTELRISLWPGLVQALGYNLNRQQTRVRLFEVGNRYLLQDNEIKEEFSVAGLVSGLQYPLQWGEPQRPADLFDVQGDIAALLATADHAKALQAVASVHPALHPGQSAKLVLDGTDIGWIGLLHPAVLKQLDFHQSAVLFELTLSPLLRTGLPALTPIPRFPSVQRDLAVVVPDPVQAAQLLAAVRVAAGSQLSDLRIFDLYRGKGIDFGRKSIALSLIFQDYTRTLTDSEADELMSRITGKLQRDLGVTIRD